MRKRVLILDHENTDLDWTILVLPPRPHVAAPWHAVFFLFLTLVFVMKQIQIYKDQNEHNKLAE